MRVVICGAGQVGWQIARQLSGEGHSVSVIDISPERIRLATEALEVQGVTGMAAHPSVLEAAGADEADLLIAATPSDEVNLTISRIARSLFDTPRIIARLRSTEYIDPARGAIFGREGFPVDVVINPEREVAAAALRRIEAPSTFDLQDFAEGRVRLVGLTLEEDCPVLETPLRQLTALFDTLRVMVVGLRRGGRLFAPEPGDRLLAGDQAYLVTEASELERVLAIFGKPAGRHERILILGAGSVGTRIAAELEAKPAGRHGRRPHVTLIERNRAVAEQAAEALGRTIVLNGDGLERALLSEAGVERSDVMLAVTDDDRTNLLAAVLGREMGCSIVVALVNDAGLGALMQPLGIDAHINPRAATVSSILRHVRHGRVRAIHSLGEGEAEVIEAQILSTSPLAGQSLAEAGFPQGALVGAVLRKGENLKLSGATRLAPGDVVVIFTLAADVPEVERLLSVAVEYF